MTQVNNEQIRFKLSILTYFLSSSGLVIGGKHSDIYGSKYLFTPINNATDVKI